MKGTLVTEVIDGGLPNLNKDAFRYVLKQFEGKQISITIERYVKRRTTPQNAYYWPVIVEYVLEGLIDAGHRREALDQNTVHDFLKGKFLRHMKRRIVNPITKKYLTRAPKTSELTTWEFMDYMDAIKQWAAEYLGVNIPDPNKEWREKAEADYLEAVKLGIHISDERNRVRIRLSLDKLAA